MVSPETGSVSVWETVGYRRMRHQFLLSMPAWVRVNFISRWPLVDSSSLVK